MTERSSSGRPHFWLRPGFWRWSVRLLVAGLLLLLAGAVWVLVYPPALEPVREDLEGWLSERLDRPVRFREVSWTWDGGFTARGMDVRIGEKGVAATEVRLGLGAWALMRGELDLRRLELRGLELELERDASGRLYGGGFRVDPERNRLFPFLARFDHVRVRDGALAWSDRSRRDPIRLGLADVALDIERISRGHLVNLTAHTAGGRVAVHGAIQRFAGGPESWELNVDTRAEGVSPGPFLPYLPPGAPAAVPGPLSLWAEVVGGWHRPTQIRGHLRLQEGELRWGKGLRGPLSGAAVSTDLRYQGEPGSHRLTLEDARLTAAGVTVTAGGELGWEAGFAQPRLDAELGMGETPVSDLRQLLALRALPRPVAEWLDRSLVAGRIEEGRAEIRGPLNRFPFADGGGTFRVEAEVAEGKLAYHPEWPAVTEVSGTLAVDRSRLTFRVDSGHVLRGRIREATASIHDLGGQPARLRLRGKAGLPLADGIRFLERSPLQPEGFLEPAVLVGPAVLDLAVDRSLTEGAEADVSGRLTLDGAAFRPRPGTPAVVNVDGEVAFQGGRIRASGLGGRLLGQPVTVDLDREPERPFRAEVTGTVPAKSLRIALARHGQGHPLSRRLTGEVGFRLGVVWGREERHAELNADLERAALILPEPVFNAIGDAGELRLRWQAAPIARVEGGLTTAKGEWRLVAAPSGDRWDLGLAGGLGREAPAAEPGLFRAVGELERLPLGRWADLLGTVPRERQGSGPAADWPRLEAEVRAGEVSWRHRDLGGARISLDGHAEDGAYAVTVDIQGERATGRLVWTREPAGGDELQVRLKRLVMAEPGEWAGAEGAPGLGSRLADLDLDLLLEAERIELGEQILEDARLQGRLLPDRWLLQALRARMGETELGVQGEWHRKTDRTRMRVDLETRDFGGWLRSVGLYPSMKGGQGSLSGNLWWLGRPTAFALGRLSGDLRLRMVEGEIEQFYFLNQALATLNVLDWPRQVARGFRDVAEGGLVYRKLKGSVHIADGVARTDDWVLKSAPLRLDMEGSLDLGARQYDLLLGVQPLQTVDQIISAVPVLGYLLAGESKTVMALGYRVRGPWDDPEVTPLTGEEQENPVETVIRRLREMEWKDVLPWR